MQIIPYQYVDQFSEVNILPILWNFGGILTGLVVDGVNTRRIRLSYPGEKAISSSHESVDHYHYPK